MEEAAVLIGGIAGAQLQGVQQLLAGDPDGGGLVVVGVYADDVPVGDLPGGDVRPDAAAVNQAHVASSTSR